MASVSARVGAMLAEGTVDVVANLASPLPVKVIADVLGVPAADYPRFREWSDLIVESLALKYQSDAQTILDFNRLRSSQLAPGTVLVIPGGVGGAFPPPPTLWQQLIQPGTGAAFNSIILGCCLGPYPATGFPVGWCTYYVATKRNVTWRGDAGFWYQNAAAAGYPVGSKPKVGAIMVTWESYLGHVAYVEAVNADGSWTVTEMNYVAFDVISQRTIKPGQLGSRLVGFIY